MLELDEAIPGRRLATRATTADYLCLSPKTLAKWACTGEVKLPYYRVMGRVVYDLDDIDRWLETRRRGS